MKLQIRNFNTNQISERFDIVIPADDSSDLKVSYVDFEFDEEPNYNITAKFFLNENNDELIEFNFVYFKNIDLIFFRFIYQWGIIDLKNRRLKRNVIDYSLDFPFFYLHENCILIVDDLFAETTTFDGETIDTIVNEQPHEIIEFEDYFEFDIIGVEKRKLMKTSSDSCKVSKIL
ncbi:hypothetical protein SAMN05444671_2164 [Flavobacterium sp. CF108]|uniref:hypothetical protein n=1 Tax=unclassified Flavobacterium TaxID=196869 RepID=UPI0008D11F0D|nr:MULTISPECIES: hypothetical protein [unclassified Flavobacterium]SEN81328.1 hypothetical protein SAMN04487978_1480 [Flavobacterium sp. fv08]SHH17922.1 hypothetical protein SAMN05444671_2164 [Flavobacterium sp. CF108]